MNLRRWSGWEKSSDGSDRVTQETQETQETQQFSGVLYGSRGGLFGIGRFGRRCVPVVSAASGNLTDHLLPMFGLARRKVVAVVIARRVGYDR